MAQDVREPWESSQGRKPAPEGDSLSTTSYLSASGRAYFLGCRGPGPALSPAGAGLRYSLFFTQGSRTRPGLYSSARWRGLTP